ncbi:MAG TPA: hypothetical protein VGE76_02575 [Opitutaceae bacterium]
MARITVSIPTTTARRAKAVARSQRRSLSAYVALLIEADVADDKPPTCTRAEAEAISEVRTHGGNPADILREAVATLITPPTSA